MSASPPRPFRVARYPVGVEFGDYDPAGIGDRLWVDTSVGEWRNRSFVMRHVVRRGDDVLLEATEVRIFAQRVPGDRRRIAAVAIPAFVREACGA